MPMKRAGQESRGIRRARPNMGNTAMPECRGIRCASYPGHARTLTIEWSHRSLELGAGTYDKVSKEHAVPDVISDLRWC